MKKDISRGELVELYEIDDDRATGYVYRCYCGTGLIAFIMPYDADLGIYMDCPKCRSIYNNNGDIPPYWAQVIKNLKFKKEWGEHLRSRDKK